jgi:acyl dehydratase
MTPRRVISLEQYRGLLGQELGASEWLSVLQSRIDAFAAVTEDYQAIHVDPIAAAQSPFGSTIAHGFLTLSLLSKMAYEVLPAVAGTVLSVNCGFERLRFVSPVRAGSRIRGRFQLKEVAERDKNTLRSTLNVTVDIDGEHKPALVGDWLTMILLDPERS